jgi:predicted nucleotidyltransferase
MSLLKASIERKRYSMDSKLHPRFAEIIRLFIGQLEAARPTLLEGWYLYGSVALDDYSIEKSDIDFIAVTSKRLEATDIALIRSIHEHVERQYALPNLSGIYITWDDLGKLEHEIEPYPYYQDGHMHEAGYFELNLVTWFELKKYGIAIVGPLTSELPFQVDEQLLISSLLTNLNTYWKGWIRKSHRLSSPFVNGKFFRRMDLEWGVLGICRLFYTFRERDITTKAAAGHYALDHVPGQWHRIIEEAILVRRGVSFSLYRSKLKRKQEALAFMVYIRNECNKMFSLQ